MPALNCKKAYDSDITHCSELYIGKLLKKHSQVIFEVGVKWDSSQDSDGETKFSNIVVM